MRIFLANRNLSSTVGSYKLYGFVFNNGIASIIVRKEVRQNSVLSIHLFNYSFIAMHLKPNEEKEASLNIRIEMEIINTKKGVS